MPSPTRTLLYSIVWRLFWPSQVPPKGKTTPGQSTRNWRRLGPSTSTHRILLRKNKSHTVFNAHFASSLFYQVWEDGNFASYETFEHLLSTDVEADGDLAHYLQSQNFEMDQRTTEHYSKCHRKPANPTPTWCPGEAYFASLPSPCHRNSSRSLRGAGDIAYNACVTEPMIFARRDRDARSKWSLIHVPRLHRLTHPDSSFCAFLALLIIFYHLVTFDSPNCRVVQY